MPSFVSPLTSGSGTLAYMSTVSGSQPQVTGSPQVASVLSPGSVLPSFGEATEYTHQQTSSASILSSAQTTFSGSQQSSLPVLSGFQTAGALPSILPSSSTTVTSSRGGAGTAMHDLRDLVVSLPPDAPKLLAVSGHTEEVETTYVSVQTHSVNAPSKGCTIQTGINSVSRSRHGRPGGAGCFLVCFFYQPLYRGFVFSGLPPSPSY